VRGNNPCFLLRTRSSSTKFNLYCIKYRGDVLRRILQVIGMSELSWIRSILGTPFRLMKYSTDREVSCLTFTSICVIDFKNMMSLLRVLVNSLIMESTLSWE
jgi:hypothetical protein